MLEVHTYETATITNGGEIKGENLDILSTHVSVKDVAKNLISNKCQKEQKKVRSQGLKLRKKKKRA